MFTAESHSGVLTPETEECSAYWESLSRIPLDKMWDADRLWLPLLLRGSWFHRAYVFDRNDQVKEERELS